MKSVQIKLESSQTHDIGEAFGVRRLDAALIRFNQSARSLPAWRSRKAKLGKRRLEILLANSILQDLWVLLSQMAY